MRSRLRPMLSASWSASTSPEVHAKWRETMVNQEQWELTLEMGIVVELCTVLREVCSGAGGTVRPGRVKDLGRTAYRLSHGCLLSPFPLAYLFTCPLPLNLCLALPPFPPPLLVLYLQFFTGSCSTTVCTTLPKWMQANGTPYCSLWQTGSLKILLLPLMKLRLALCDLPCRGQYQQLKYLPLLYVILYCSFTRHPRRPS